MFNTARNWESPLSFNDAIETFSTDVVCYELQEYVINLIEFRSQLVQKIFQRNWEFKKVRFVFCNDFIRWNNEKIDIAIEHSRVDESHGGRACFFFIFFYSINYYHWNLFEDVIIFFFLAVSWVTISFSLWKWNIRFAIYSL